MEPPPAAATAAKFPAGHGIKLRLFAGGSSSYQDPDVVELGSSSWGSSQQKRKRSQVVPHDVIDIGDDDPDEVDDRDGVVIIGESTSDYKNKQPMRYDKDHQKQSKDAFTNKHVGPSAILISDNVPMADMPNSSDSDLLDFNYSIGIGYEDYEFDDDDYYEGYEYDNDLDDNDFNFSLAAKFDDLDLPPGVEAPVPWLQKPAPEKSSRNKPKIVIEDEVDVKFKSFKQFDTVQDHSDHYFSRSEFIQGIAVVKKPAKDWGKRIQHEWKVLEKDLPETIYVRVYEDRMDLLRALIIGPAGTPYHDGLFFFDVFFPPNYPQVPPMVHYHAGGLRLNPNLYACGKVCLSLLNTWSGSGCEKWNPSNSTMLQVLVSIQALVLNAKPYFNEPGYAHTANTPRGEKSSLLYNEEAYLLSCKTMLYTLRRPPKHFEDFVSGYFRKHGHAILVACRAYINGAQVGCVVGEGVQDVDEGDKSSSSSFKGSAKRLFEDLLMEFTVKGADCDEFLAQKVKEGAARSADTTLKL